MRTVKICQLMLGMLMALTGCYNPPDLNTSPRVGMSDHQVVVDTGLVFNTDQTSELGERYERWIHLMDPFVHQNQDGTFEFNYNGFVNSLYYIQMDAYRYYVYNDVATPDTQVTNSLITGINLANDCARQEHQITDGRSYNWWGQQQCYGHSDADREQDQLCRTPNVADAYVAALCYQADECNDAYDRFCVNWNWTTGFTWISCW